METPSLMMFLMGGIAVFVFNLLLMIFLMLRNTRQVEKAMSPILRGIQDLSRGNYQPLDEGGELAEINAGLNRAGDYLMQKDNTRAEWIRGVSHDIRTPLSMVLGYASELEDDAALPPEARQQAGMIRRQGERLKSLVEDLNLTTKLEYALQPIRRESVDLVEIGRQAVSEVLNSGLPEQYETGIFRGASRQHGPDAGRRRPSPADAGQSDSQLHGPQSPGMPHLCYRRGGGWAMHLHGRG